ncbi:MAG: hypothetical protein M3M85_03180 [bacterium]|nr:hypothetical protein [bacterium]
MSQPNERVDFLIKVLNRTSYSGVEGDAELRHYHPVTLGRVMQAIIVAVVGFQGDPRSFGMSQISGIVSGIGALRMPADVPGHSRAVGRTTARFASQIGKLSEDQYNAVKRAQGSVFWKVAPVFEYRSLPIALDEYGRLVDKNGEVVKRVTPEHLFVPNDRTMFHSRFSDYYGGSPRPSLGPEALLVLKTIQEDEEKPPAVPDDYDEYLMAHFRQRAVSLFGEESARAIFDVTAEDISVLRVTQVGLFHAVANAKCRFDLDHAAEEIFSEEVLNLVGIQEGTSLIGLVRQLVASK